MRQLIEQLTPEELKRTDDEAKRVRAEQHREYLLTRATEGEGLSEESPMHVRERNVEPALEPGAEGSEEAEADSGPDSFGIHFR